jgi:two-component system, cell cycle sensor histidine kinase and response regulator CckA
MRPDEWFRTILEHAPVMIDLFEADGRCVIWNRECVRRLGWTKEELGDLDDPLAVFYPDPRVLEQVREDIRRADGQFREYTAIAKGGAERIQLWANFRTTGTTSIISVGHDVTEQRAMESRLRQAQKMEALGRLTGGIAHDFNNLLTVIFSGAELLLREVPVGSTAAELTTEIRQAARDGAELVRQIGSFSRHDRLTMAPLDLHTLLGDTLSALRRLLPESIGIRLDHSADPLYVVGDSLALKQVIVNLTTNARDAIDGQGTIEISTRRVSGEPRDRAVLTVRDSGRGMEPALLDRAFEPFFTTKPAGKGTGLGLPTVYGIVEQHGGTLEISSEPGHGTCVTVSLPAIEHRAATAPAKVDSAELPRGTELVLVAEDDEGTRAIARSALRYLGYEVLVAEDGEAALHLLESTPGIVLVLSDVVMPGLNGPELLAKLRERDAPVPAFGFLSGYAPREAATRLDPEIPLLTKPWTIAALARFVRRCLDGRSPSERAEGSDHTPR